VNIKLASVASDVLGASVRAMLKAIVKGESDPAILTDLAQKRLRAKLPELRSFGTRGRTESRTLGRKCSDGDAR